MCSKRNNNNKGLCVICAGKRRFDCDNCWAKCKVAISIGTNLSTMTSSCRMPRSAPVICEEWLWGRRRMPYWVAPGGPQPSLQDVGAQLQRWSTPTPATHRRPDDTPTKGARHAHTSPRTPYNQFINYFGFFRVITAPRSRLVRGFALFKLKLNTSTYSSF